MQTPQLKKPGQHRQEMLVAIGHGADTTMYFQWRQSQGSAEKFHGAVVQHGETERTRVFQDIAAHGALLKHLDAVVGTTVRPDVALVYDTEVRWALMYSQGPRQTNPRTPFDKDYAQTCQEHYRPFWKLGIPVDVIESLSDFTRYRLIVAPMLFMLKPGVVGSPGGVRQERRHARPDVSVRRRERDRAGAARRLARRRPAEARRASGRRRSTRCIRTRRSASCRRPATRWA